MPGRRRNPWRARKTTGYVAVDADGNTVPVGSPQAVSTRQQYVIVGYFRTRADAMTALATYNGEDTEQVPTFAEMYDKFTEGYFETISPDTASAIRTSFKHLHDIHSTPVDSFTTVMLDDFLRTYDGTQVVKRRMRTLIKQVLGYAVKKQYLTSNPAENTDIYAQPAATIDRNLFTAAELETVKRCGDKLAPAIIVACYSGWRPAEILDLKKADINWEDMTMRGGMKTKAGKNRLVPIHPEIADILKTASDRSTSERVFPYSYSRYLTLFTMLKKDYNIVHKPHDTRHTFVTCATVSGMDPLALKRIVGHAVTDVTEAVYTHLSIDQLKNEMLKLRII